MPGCHEGDTQEETQGATELRYQGGEGVDQHLSLHFGVLGHRPHGEDELVRHRAGGNHVAHEPVLAVDTRLATPCH